MIIIFEKKYDYTPHTLLLIAYNIAIPFAQCQTATGPILSNLNYVYKGVNTYYKKHLQKTH